MVSDKRAIGRRLPVDLAMAIVTSLRIGDHTIPFSVVVDGLSQDESSLLTRLVAPYWTTGAPATRSEQISVRIVRENNVRTGIEDRYRLLTGERMVILFAGTNAKTTVLLVISVVRVILKIAVIALHGGANYHTCVVDNGGSGVLVTGPRGAGKTTVLRACAAAHFALVANDQCVVLSHEERLLAVGFPALMAVRPDALSPRYRLPTVPVVTAVDKQDGDVRQHYDLPTLAEVNGTTCAAQTSVRLLVSYTRVTGTNMLEAVRAAPDEWITAATFDLSTAYDPALVAFAAALSSQTADGGSVDVRSALRVVSHYRITCSTDMLRHVPNKFVELTEQANGR
jgi:hypothetical protein